MDVILLQDLKGIGAKGATVHVKLVRPQLPAPAPARHPRGLQRRNLYQGSSASATARSRSCSPRPASRRAARGVEVNIRPRPTRKTPCSDRSARTTWRALTRPATRVDKRQIGLEDHIKQLGKYDVPVHVYPV